MGAWKYQIYFSLFQDAQYGVTCSTLEINLVFSRTHVLFSIYSPEKPYLFPGETIARQTFALLYRVHNKEALFGSPLHKNIVMSFFPLSILLTRCHNLDRVCAQYRHFIFYISRHFKAMLLVRIYANRATHGDSIGSSKSTEEKGNIS
jgi:hypothetical protein